MTWLHCLYDEDHGTYQSVTTILENSMCVFGSFYCSFSQINNSVTQFVVKT